MNSENIMNPDIERIDLLETLVDESKDGIIVIDVNGIIRYADPSAQVIFGLQTDNLVGLEFGIPVFDRRFEFCLLDDQRTILEMQVSKFDFRGEIAYLLIIQHSTDWIRSEEELEEHALQQSKSRYQQLFKHAIFGFALHEMVYDEKGDPQDFVYVEVNDSFGVQTGLDTTNLIGKTASEVLPRAKSSGLIDKYGEIGKTGKPLQFEYYSSDLERYFQISAYSPQKGFVASSISNISERILAENRLRQSEGKYRTLFESMSQGVVYQNPQGEILSVNPAAEQILGKSLNEIQGKSSFDSDWNAIRLNGEDLPGSEHPAMVALRTGKVVEDYTFGVYNPRRKEIVWISVSSIPQFHDGENDPYQVFTTFLDITDQVRVQKALEERIKELRCLSQVSAIIQENQSLDEICAMIANEIVHGMQFPELTIVQIQLAGKIFSSAKQFKATQYKLSVPIRVQDQILGRIIVCYLEDRPFLLPEELNLLEGIAERLSLWYRQNQTQAQLEESERRFRNGIMDAPNPIMIHAEDGEVIDVNDAWVEGSGYHREEIRTVKQWMKLAHPDQYTNIQHIVREGFETERNTANGEYPVHTKSGVVLHWYFNTAPLGNLPDGRRVVITVAIDITDRILAEREKDQYYDRIIALQEIDKTMVSTLDLNQVIDRITSQLGNVIQFDSMSVMLIEDNEIRLIACQGFEKPEELLNLRFPSEPGFPNYEVIKYMEPLALRNVSEDFPKFVQPGKQHLSGEIKAWLGVPLVNLEKVIGMFTIDRLEDKPFTDQDIVVAMQYANRAAIAITNAQLFEQTKSQIEKLEILRKIDATITTSVDLSDALETILTQVRNGLDVDIVTVFLYNGNDQTLNYTQSVGYKTKGHPKVKVNVGQGYVGTVAAKMKPLFVPVVDLTDDGYRYPFSFKKEGVVSYYGFPLVSKGEMQGVLQVLNRKELHPDADWVEFAETLARQMAITVDNLTLFKDLETTNQELREAYDATIEGWAHALEIRDKETEGHSRRVEILTVEVAKAFGFTPEELTHIRRGVLLHDIGKMGIPDHILHKSGPLTEEEWVVMQQHPVYAYDMLKSIEYLKPALIIPHYHHERWDGSGYPDGLKGEKIPLEARIFAVVDAWDALTSDRPYRKAWTIEETQDYLNKQAGKEFDPEVVKVFLNIVNRK